jgi:hypothetical protein
MLGICLREVCGADAEPQKGEETGKRRMRQESTAGRKDRSTGRSTGRAYPVFQACLRGKKEKNGMGSCYFIAFLKEFMLKIVTKPDPSCKILW